MPILTKSLPKYRKHRATGQAIVTLSGRDHHYHGPHNTKTSKLEYDRLVAEWLTAGRPTALAAEENDVTVAELIVAYLRYAECRHCSCSLREIDAVEKLLRVFVPALALQRTSLA